MPTIRIYTSSVFSLLRRLPRGTVTTYGAIAKRCGMSNPRTAGFVLRLNDDPDRIPCYKVVRADGSLARGYKFGGMRAQRKRLKLNGVRFSGTKVAPDSIIR